MKYHFDIILNHVKRDRWKFNKFDDDRYNALADGALTIFGKENINFTDKNILIDTCYLGGGLNLNLSFNEEKIYISVLNLNKLIFKEHKDISLNYLETTRFMCVETCFNFLVLYKELIDFLKKNEG